MSVSASRGLLLSIALLLSACAVKPVREAINYSQLKNQHLYDLSDWQFMGRIAMSNKHDSWSAHIDWLHRADQDIVNLSGPLRQGAVRIVMRSDSIMIDQGDGQVGFSKNVDQYIRQQLGFYVPASALRFWVTGLSKPAQSFVRHDDGFSQLYWDIHYHDFMKVSEEIMPRKISIKNKSAKLKLVIDQWILSDR